MTRRKQTPLVALTVILVAAASACSRGPAGDKSLPAVTLDDAHRVITASCRIAPGLLTAGDAGGGAVRIEADDVTVDFGGAVIASCDVEKAAGNGFDGTGLLIKGRKNVTVKNAVVRGYRYDIRVEECRNVRLVGCSADFSRAEKLVDQGVPANEFLNMRDLAAWRDCGAGIWLEKAEGCRVEDCRAVRAQNGLIMVGSNGCTVIGNDFSFNSGWGVALWKSSDNVVAWNRADFVNRLCGFYFGLDSTAIALNDDCNRNYFVGNSITHGGDGFFLADFNESGADTKLVKVLPKGASNDNVIALNDASWSPCNAFEGTFASGNVYYRNLANDSTVGYWLGYARDTWVLGGEIKRTTIEGVAIEHGTGNRVEGNVFDSNAGIDIQMWVAKDQPTGNHPSTGFEVRGNIIRNSRRPFDFGGSTDYYVGENTLENSTPPEGVTGTRPPDKRTAVSIFESSSRYKKLEAILAEKPAGFKAYREGAGPFGMRWFNMDEFAPHDFREDPAVKSSVGWSGLDLFVFDPDAVKLETKGAVSVEPDAGDPHVRHVRPAKPAAGEIVPYALELTKDGRTWTIVGDLVAADWRLDWRAWDGRPVPENDGIWQSLFAGPPVAGERTADIDWTMDRVPPAALAGKGMAVQASARIVFPAGTYRFAGGCRGGFRILIDGRPVVTTWKPWGNAQPGATVELAAGPHDVVIQYIHAAGRTELRLYWSRLTR